MVKLAIGVGAVPELVAGVGRGGVLLGRPKLAAGLGGLLGDGEDTQGAWV